MLCNDRKSWYQRIELLSFYLLVWFWIKDIILFFGLRENSAKKLNDAHLFNYTMAVLLDFAVTCDFRTEKLRAYFKRENSLLIYINEILQNSSPMFCSALGQRLLHFLNCTGKFISRQLCCKVLKRALYKAQEFSKRHLKRQVFSCNWWFYYSTTWRTSSYHHLIIITKTLNRRSELLFSIMTSW